MIGAGSLLLKFCARALKSRLLTLPSVTLRPHVVGRAKVCCHSVEVQRVHFAVHVGIAGVNQPDQRVGAVYRRAAKRRSAERGVVGVANGESGAPSNAASTKRFGTRHWKRSAALIWLGQSCCSRQRNSPLHKSPRNAVSHIPVGSARPFTNSSTSRPRNTGHVRRQRSDDRFVPLSSRHQQSGSHPEKRHRLRNQRSKRRA